MQNEHLHSLHREYCLAGMAVYSNWAKLEQATKTNRPGFSDLHAKQLSLLMRLTHTEL